MKKKKTFGKHSKRSRRGYGIQKATAINWFGSNLEVKTRFNFQSGRVI